jgi:hypothetical protein
MNNKNFIEKDSEYLVNFVDNLSLDNCTEYEWESWSISSPIDASNLGFEKICVIIGTAG